jgi:polyisoprenoid-binding protein YceI
MRLMSCKPLLLAAALAFAPAFASAATTAYAIDANHTQILFTYAHLGMSHITGSFEKVEGTFDFDAADPTASKIAVTIPIASLSTGVPRLDAHMQSADMFDMAQFPTATFTSTKVSKGANGHLAVAGDLTIHGVTRPVVLDVTVNFVGAHPMSKQPVAGFDATTTIKRSDFGVNYGVPNVSDEIGIRITMEAGVPKAPAKP